MSQAIQQYDIVIVGGGLIGMSMAVALADAPCTVLLLEQNKVAPVNANMLDLRTTGLTRSSEKVFSYLGLWEKLRFRLYFSTQTKSYSRRASSFILQSIQ